MRRPFRFDPVSTCCDCTIIYDVLSCYPSFAEDPHWTVSGSADLVPIAHVAPAPRVRWYWDYERQQGTFPFQPIAKWCRADKAGWWASVTEGPSSGDTLQIELDTAHPFRVGDRLLVRDTKYFSFGSLSAGRIYRKQGQKLWLVLDRVLGPDPGDPLALNPGDRVELVDLLTRVGTCTQHIEPDVIRVDYPDGTDLVAGEFVGFPGIGGEVLSVSSSSVLVRKFPLPLPELGQPVWLSPMAGGLCPSVVKPPSPGTAIGQAAIVAQHAERGLRLDGSITFRGPTLPALARIALHVVDGHVGADFSVTFRGDATRWTIGAMVTQTQTDPQTGEQVEKLVVVAPSTIASGGKTFDGALYVVDGVLFTGDVGVGYWREGDGTVVAQAGPQSVFCGYAAVVDNLDGDDLTITADGQEKFTRVSAFAVEEDDQVVSGLQATGWLATRSGDSGGTFAFYGSYNGGVNDNVAPGRVDVSWWNGHRTDMDYSPPALSGGTGADFPPEGTAIHVTSKLDPDVTGPMPFAGYYGGAKYFRHPSSGWVWWRQEAAGHDSGWRYILSPSLGDDSTGWRQNGVVAFPPDSATPGIIAGVTGLPRVERRGCRDLPRICPGAYADQIPRGLEIRVPHLEHNTCGDLWERTYGVERQIDAGYCCQWASADYTTPADPCAPLLFIGEATAAWGVGLDGTGISVQLVILYRYPWSTTQQAVHVLQWQAEITDPLDLENLSDMAIEPTAATAAAWDVEAVYLSTASGAPYKDADHTELDPSYQAGTGLPPSIDIDMPAYPSNFYHGWPEGWEDAYNWAALNQPVTLTLGDGCVYSYADDDVIWYAALTRSGDDAEVAIVADLAPKSGRGGGHMSMVFRGGGKVGSACAELDSGTFPFASATGYVTLNGQCQITV